MNDERVETVMTWWLTKMTVQRAKLEMNASNDGARSHIFDELYYCTNKDRTIS